MSITVAFTSQDHSARMRTAMGHYPASFYLKTGVVARALVDDPPPITVELRVTIVPPQSVSERWFSVASGSVTCRRTMNDGEAASYEPHEASAEAEGSADAVVYMNAEAAKRLHTGELSAAEIIADVVGRPAPPRA